MSDINEGSFEFDEENKIIYEDLSPSLQNLLKNNANKDDLLLLIDKLEKVIKGGGIGGSISEDEDNPSQKNKREIDLWKEFHKKNNYAPTANTNKSWNNLGLTIINYDQDNIIPNQPQAMGQLINIPYGEPNSNSNQSLQFWIDQPTGNIRFRSGSDDVQIGDQKFKRLLTEDDANNISESSSKKIYEAYPVGSVYITIKHQNPKDILGYGVWSRIKNCYMYCASDDLNMDIDPDVTREGENMVSLKEENLPSHYHTGTTYSAGDHTHTVTITDSGLQGGISFMGANNTSKFGYSIESSIKPSGIFTKTVTNGTKKADDIDVPNIPTWPSSFGTHKEINPRNIYPDLLLGACCNFHASTEHYITHKHHEDYDNYRTTISSSRAKFGYEDTQEVKISIDSNNISSKGITSNSGSHRHTFATDTTGKNVPFAVAPVRIPLYVWYRTY